MCWRLLPVVTLALAASPLCAQTLPQPLPPAPQLSPQAAYDRASAPVDITHRSKENWSDIEKASLDVAARQAKEDCLARKAVHYTGDDLIAYARLCDLGLQWPVVHSAAVDYLSSTDAAKPQLDQAYAYEVVADLNLQQPKDASRDCFAMMRAIPYGLVADSVTTTTIRYLQFAYAADALDLLTQRQPHLLKLLRGSPPNAVLGPIASAVSLAPQPIPLHILFEHALELAAMQQYDDQPQRAVGILADIDRAMPSSLPPDEAILIAADRRQYALLGTHFPELPGAVSLLAAADPSRSQPRFGLATIFLLFPPWCAQCIRQAQEMVPALARAVSGDKPDDRVHIYALLADIPQSPAAKVPGARTHPATQKQLNAAAEPERLDAPPSAQDQLRKTPTLVVAPATLADFNATDFPFLIATDHNGIIRLLVPAAPDNALVRDGPVDQIVDTIVANWPPPRPAKP